MGVWVSLVGGRSLHSDCLFDGVQLAALAHLGDLALDDARGVCVVKARRFKQDVPRVAGAVDWV